MNNNEIADNETGNETVVNAQEMTDAIYNAHAAVNEAVMGGILKTEEEEEVKREANEPDTETANEPATETVDEPATETANEPATETVNEDVNMEKTVNEDVNMEKTVETTPHTDAHTEAHTEISNTPVPFVSPQLVKEQLKYCQRILKGLKRHREAGPFLLPVDPVALGIPDYFDVIKQPMDLGTISKKCDLNEYGSAEAFMADVRLMLTNCFTYNAPDSQVTKMGRSLEKYFNTSMSKMPTDLSGVNSGVSGTLNSSSSSIIESPASRPKRESVVSATAVRRPSSPSGSMTFCSAVLRELMKKTNSHLNWPFMLPVDPIALGIPDYFDVIKQPMDLGTIRKKLDTGMYARPEQFESDVRLVFSNCYTYNPPESDVHRMAQQLEAIFDQKMTQKPTKVDKPVTATNSATSSTSGSLSNIQGHTHSHSHSHSQGHSHTVANSNSFIPSSASQLIPGLDALEDDSEKILAINHQIQILQAELNYLLLNRKSTSSASVGAGAGGSKSSGSLAASGKPKKKPTAATSTPSTLNKPTSSANLNSSEEMSFEEKRQLSEDVSNLPQENMMRVLEIIQECMPNLHSNGDSDVIELDIEALDLRTLRTLQAYIWECNNPGKKRKSLSKVTTNVSKKTKETNTSANTSANANGNASANVNNYDLSSSSSSEDDD